MNDIFSIKDGKFNIDGRTYSLATNNGPNHLHGGVHGFDKKLWCHKTEVVIPSTQDSSAGVSFSYLSADGEEGYPGNLSVSVRYELRANDDIHISFAAETDQTTPV